MSVEFKIDPAALAAARKALDALDAKTAKSVIQKATTGAAAVLKGPMKSEAPVKKRATAGKRGPGYGQPGDLRASIRAVKVRDVRAGEIASIVGPMGRKGFTRHWVIQGTKPHMIGPRAHPGSQPNPFVARAVDANESKVADTFEKELDKHVQRAWAKRG